MMDKKMMRELGSPGRPIDSRTAPTARATSEVLSACATCKHAEWKKTTIAAAPELLAALKALVAGVERDDNPYDQGHASFSNEMIAATAAIQKAEAR
jgi:hypothetical protein